MDNGDDKTEVVALPQPFPGYELLRQLGQGGMARVYLAREESLDRLVAIKVMSEALLSEDFIQRFAAEAKTAAQLRHPNIVVVHASGQSEDQPYIVFEHIAGGDLEQRLEGEGALAEADAVDIATKIADALAYLHKRNLVHRDIKPGNILFNSDGAPILADFGIAMDLASDARLTQAGAIIGSPRYMSPEQLRSGSVTAKSDMYALGLVLLEMLGGRLPPSSDLTEFLSRAGPYESLVADLLAANPENRPTAEECLARLREASAASARRWFWPATAIATVVLLALLTWVVGQSPKLTDIQVTVLPDQAQLYLNGELQNDLLVRVSDVPQQLVVVAPGFVGESKRLSGDLPELVSFELEPLKVPTARQYYDFHAAFDDASISSEQLLGIATDYPLFDQLLRMRADIAQDRVAFSDSLIALAARADAGDAAAQVAAFLLASEGYADFPPARTDLWLKNASARAGYSLASFYRALHFREQQKAIGSFGNPEVVEFQNLLQLAERQGLPFGSSELRLLDEATE